MKNNADDIIDIPTELVVEEIENLDDEIETLNVNESFFENNSVEVVKENEELNSLDINDNNELQEVSKNVEHKESIDGNPDVIDMEVKEQDVSNSKKKNILGKILIIVSIIGLILGLAFSYYKFIYLKKDNSVNKSELLVKNLKINSSFEEAYQKKEALFQEKDEGINTSYQVNGGKIVYTYNEQKINLEIENADIIKISYLDNNDKDEIIALQDSENNFYFAHINPDIQKDAILTKQNNKLIKINDNENISNIAIARHLNNNEIFYLAIRNGTNYYITINEDDSISLDAVITKLYNGINIDFKWLNLEQEKISKLPFSGVGLYYDGALYFYEGNIETIKEIEVKNNNESLDCKEIFIAYTKDLKYFDLYIVSDDDYLYEIDLLNVDFKEEKINIKDYKNKIAEYTILQSDIANSVDINFENGESIKLK